MKQVTSDELLAELNTLQVESDTTYSLQKIYDATELKDRYTLDSVQSAYLDLLDLGYVDGKKYQQQPDDWTFKRVTATGKTHLSDG